MRLEPAPRLPRAPAWAWLTVLAWAGLVAVAALLERLLGLSLATCMFKRVTGLPCPSCGATRAGLALLGGHPLRALAWNPLLVGLGFLGLGYLAFRAATGLTPRLDLGPAARRWLWGLGALALAANWAYLIRIGA